MVIFNTNFIWLTVGVFLIMSGIWTLLSCGDMARNNQPKAYVAGGLIITFVLLLAGEIFRLVAYKGFLV